MYASHTTNYPYMGMYQIYNFLSAPATHRHEDTIDTGPDMGQGSLCYSFVHGPSCGLSPRGPFTLISSFITVPRILMLCPNFAKSGCDHPRVLTLFVHHPPNSYVIGNYIHTYQYKHQSGPR